MAKFLFWVIVALLIVLGGFYLFNSSPSDNSAITGSTSRNLSEDNNVGENVKTFVITGAHLRFYMEGIENPELKVNQGDRVRIEFISEEGFHDWVLDEFNAATDRVGPGASAPTIEFIADKKGTFEYYCSVGEHRANGMKGVFVVE